MIQGDLQDAVAEIRLPSSDPSMTGYCPLPAPEESGLDTAELLPGEYDLEYETDTLILNVHVSVPETGLLTPNDAAREESTASQTSSVPFSLRRENPETSEEGTQKLSMTVTPLEEASEDYLRLEDYVRRNLTEDAFTLEALRIQLLRVSRPWTWKPSP